MDAVKFYVDTLCPFCYQTSRWIHRLEELGLVETDWGVFSLEVQNAAEGVDPHTIDARAGAALRTAMRIRDLHGSKAIGPFYKAVGKRRWEQNPPVVDLADAVREALDEIGLPQSLLDEAMADPATWDAVIEEHSQLLERTRSFGVPTIVLDGGTGPAIFGPVISEFPDNDEDAIALWEHVSWLTRYENFSELKRDRISPPVLPAREFWSQVNRERRAQEAAAAGS